MSSDIKAKLKTCKEKLQTCFDILQVLDIQPTLGNMEKLVQVLYYLREVYNELGGDESGGTEDNSPQRDNV